jgi:probable HAF family extracellular repeat protein
LNSIGDPTEIIPLGGDLSEGAGVNNRGWVVGDANVPSNNNEHATVWREGVITDLGTLGGPNSSIGFIGADPNDSGLITGNAQTAVLDPLGEYWGVNFGCTAGNVTCDGWQYLFRGFAWKDGVMTALPTLGGNNTAALGRANRLGEIVGLSETATPDPNCVAPQVLDWVPVIWEPNGEIRKMPLYPGDTVGATSAINDNGQAVGGTGFCASPGTAAITHAVLWENGKVTDLGSLGGVMNNVGVSINNRGQVVGLSDLPGDTTSHAFLWQNGVMTDLSTLPGDVLSIAFEINNRGQVVGESCDVNFNCRAFLWENGAMTDLNALTPPNSPLFLMAASGINDSGEVVGFAINPSTGFAPGFVAMPCDEAHASLDDCTWSTSAAEAGDNERPRLILTENVRIRLRRGLTVIMFGVGSEARAASD